MAKPITPRPIQAQPLNSLALQQVSALQAGINSSNASITTTQTALAALQSSVSVNQTATTQAQASIASMNASIAALEARPVGGNGLFLQNVSGYVHGGGNNFSALLAGIAQARAAGVDLIMPPGVVNVTVPAATSYDLSGVILRGVGKHKTTLAVTWTTDYQPVFLVAGNNSGVMDMTMTFSSSGTKLLVFRRNTGDDFELNRCRFVGTYTSSNSATHDALLVASGNNAGTVSGTYIARCEIENFNFTIMQDSASLLIHKRLRIFGNRVTGAFGSALGINCPNAPIEDAVWQHNTIINTGVPSTKAHSFGIDVASGNDITIDSNKFYGDFVDAIHFEEGVKRATVQNNTGTVNRVAIWFQDNRGYNVAGAFKAPRRIVIDGNIFDRVAAGNGATGNHVGMNLVYDATTKPPFLEGGITNNIMRGFYQGFAIHGFVSVGTSTISANDDTAEQGETVTASGIVSGNQAIDCNTGFLCFNTNHLRGNKSIRCVTGAEIRTGVLLDHTFEQCSTLAANGSTTNANVLSNPVIVTNAVEIAASGSNSFNLFSGASNYYLRSVQLSYFAQAAYRMQVYEGAKSQSGVVTQPSSEFSFGHASLPAPTVNATADGFQVTVNNTSGAPYGCMIQARIDGLITV